MSNEKREPGEAWTCPEGHNHFMCWSCEQDFMSNPTFSEAEALTEAQEAGFDLNSRVSVCDNCYPLMIRQAKESGMIP